METLGDRIRKIRKSIDYAKTQKLFAESLGITQASLSDLENGVTKDISGPLQLLLSLKYDVNIDYLLKGEGEMFRHTSNQSSVKGNGSTSVAGNGNQVTNTDVAGLIELQKGYQEMLKKKDEQIDRLLSIIEKSSVK